jgi:hypothetical protein
VRGRQGVGCAIAAALLVGAAVATAEEEPETLGEVVVIGEKVRISELREAAEKAEDAFYRRYNEVNKNDDLDINCHVGRKGLFREHKCLAVYVESAQASDGREAALMYGVCNVELQDLVLHGGCGFIPRAEQIANSRKKELAEALLRAIRADSGLRELAERRERLEREIRAARADKFDKKPPADDEGNVAPVP